MRRPRARRHRPRPARVWAAGCLVAVVALLAVAGCGSGSNGATVRLRSAFVLQVHTSVLVNQSGHALYLYLPDHRRAVTCAGPCALVWPPLKLPTHGHVVAGAGVQARLVGSLPDPAGGRVVTYAGWPLYTYENDVQPDIAGGQGTNLNGGFWYLLRPDGTALVPAGDPPAS